MACPTATKEEQPLKIKLELIKTADGFLLLLELVVRNVSLTIQLKA